jgi:hypothetical protein
VIWAIVYGALAFATLVVVTVLAVRIAKEAKVLSKVVDGSSARMAAALADIERVSSAATTSEARHSAGPGGGWVRQAPTIERRRLRKRPRRGS